MHTILSVARGHNGSATLMVDGKVLWYIEEERLTRRKYDGSPLMAMLKAFETVDRIDELVVCHTHRHGGSLDWTCEDMYQGWCRKLNRSKYETKVTFIDTIHHQMHATVSFINSGFETAACVVADGAGSFLKTDENICPKTVFEGESIYKASYPLKLESVYKHYFTDHPIGYRKMHVPEGSNDKGEYLLTEYPGITKCYESVTEFCGFKSIEAGKTMGLSPYGEPNDSIPPLIREGWGNRDMFVPNYPNNSSVNYFKYPELMKDVEKHKEGEYTKLQKDMAYTVQKETEDAMIALIRKAHEETGEKNIVISGGYGLNCVSNYKYLKAFPDLNIYCEPISHDGGTSMGGAYHVSNLNKPITAPQPQRKNIYYGPRYNPETYLDCLNGEGVYFKSKIAETSYDDVAQLIREGNIVTIYQGSSEGGPRALGNRSILFDPTIKNGKDLVNSVKHREFFRPFACSILAEKVHDWFDLAGMEDSPTMMYAVKCLEGVEEKIPSVIHVDGTCRIQTVTEEQNEHYYKLIQAFEKITDVPILFNTSFNLGGHPLVENPIDAFETVVHSNIEYIYFPEIQRLVYISNEENKDLVFKHGENGHTLGIQGPQQPPTEL